MSIADATHRHWQTKRTQLNPSLWSSLPAALVQLERASRDFEVTDLVEAVRRDKAEAERLARELDDRRHTAIVEMAAVLDQRADGVSVEPWMLRDLVDYLEDTVRPLVPGNPRFRLWRAVSPREVVLVAGKSDSDDSTIRRPVKAKPAFTGIQERRETQHVVDGPYGKLTEVERLMHVGGRVLGLLTVEFEGVGDIPDGVEAILDLISTQVEVALLSSALTERAAEDATARGRENLARQVLHDAGNSVSTVRNIAELLRTTMRDPRIQFMDDLDLEVEDRIETILTNARVLNSALDRLRFETVSAVTLDIVIELRTLIESVSQQFPVMCSMAGMKSVMVSCVRSSLRSALLNLLLNAAQAIARADPDREGIIAVDVKVAPIDGISCVIVSVQDDGPGIAPDNIPMLWNRGPKYHADSHGQGLPNSRESLVQAGGGLRLVDGYGRLGGAHFEAWVPMAERGSWDGRDLTG